MLAVASESITWPPAAYATAPSYAKELVLLLGASSLAVAGTTLPHRLKRSRSRSQPVRRVVIAGDPARLSRWSDQHQQLLKIYRLTAVIGIGAGREHCHELRDVPLIPDLKTLQELAASRQFDELWLALPIAANEAVRDYIKAMQHYFVNVRLLIDAQDIPLFNPNGTTLGDCAFIDLVASPKRSAMRRLKPVFDRVFAFTVLTLLLPLMALLALAVKISSPGPALFKQRRLGLDGREFTILKFRSMRSHAGTNGHPGAHRHRIQSQGRRRDLSDAGRYGSSPYRAVPECPR